jgi:tetratricopeptide (TPR) repeat protein
LAPLACSQSWAGREKRMPETTLCETLRLAEDDIGAGRPAEALTRCQHILTHEPEMLEARRVLGEAYLALRNTKEAFQAFDQVLISDPENTLAYCGRALISQLIGDYDSALDCYYQACELSLGNRQLRLEFRRLANQANQPDFVLSRVGLARLYMRGDLLAHAIREWEQILQGDPERIDAHIGLAEALWRDGQSTRAAQRCQIILEAVPSCLKALLLLSEIAYRAGRQEEAQHYRAEARRQDPDGRMARELFADALINDKDWAAFLLAEPARIPAMEAPSGERPKQASDIQAIVLPETTEQPSGSSIAQGNSGAASNPGFSLPFLAADAQGDGPPLREGESLEEMLAALIERPAQPEKAPPPVPSPESANKRPKARFQALLESFSHPEQHNVPIIPTPAGSSPNVPEPEPNAPAAPAASAPADTSGFAEALFWLDTNSQQPQASLPITPGMFTTVEQTTPAPPPAPQRSDEGPALLRPLNQEPWAEEEDTEAGWLRWLQAQGARPIHTSQDDLEEDSPFAALLGRSLQTTQPTPLWEAPDPEFVRSFWPSDTVPHPVVRLTPGSSSRSFSNTEGKASTNQRGDSTPGADAAALAGLSSVSLRPLTLQELEQTLSVSGLTRLEGVLPATAANNDASWETDFGENPVLTIAEDDYVGRLELAERQRKTGRIDEALGHYRAIIRGAPELVDRVIVGLQEAIGAGPEQAAAYRLLGDAYTRRGAYMEALEAYNRGLAASRGQ